jgi:hypothetical protein
MVYILGSDHYLQGYALGDPEDVREIELNSKHNFYAIVEEIVGTHKIEFIGEECKVGQKTIPRAIAKEVGCKYAEVDMPAIEREKRGIASDYERREDEKSRGYALREDYMLERIYTESNVGARKLIVCGALHIESLARGCKMRGDEVTTRDVTKEAWLATAYQERFRILLG